MTANRSVISHLRDATAEAHKGLEDKIDAVARLSLDADRRVLVPRYYLMHAMAEAAAEPLVLFLPGLDFTFRRRTPLLAQDLHALDLPLPALPSPSLDLASPAEALGLLYVMEGSSLGGRMIRKAIAARGADLTGLSFLDPYAEQTGERWRAFLSVLEREGASDPDAATRGGVKGFAHAKACLLLDATGS